MQTAVQQKYARSLVTLLAVIVTGVMLNILGTNLNTALGLPLFIDSVGTILSAAAGGYIPCITVGFCTNVILGFYDPYTTYYCIISVFIAAAAVFFAKKRMLTRFPHVLAAVAGFAVIGGLLGGSLTWLINGMSFGEGFSVDLAASVNSVVPIGYFPSNLLSCFLVDLADKALCTAVALLIYFLLPKGLRSYISDRSWYLINVLDNSKKLCRKKISLSIKSALLVAISITLVASAAIGISIYQYHNRTVDSYTEKGNEITAVMAELLDRDTVESYIQDGEKAPGYEDLMEFLERVKKASPEIRFLYGYRITEEGSLVVFDLPVEGVEPDVSGELLAHDATVEKYLDLFLQGQEIPPDVTQEEEYGWLLSVYRPVYDKSGDLLCYVVADLSMDRLRSDEIAYLTKLISLFLGILLLIRTYAVWLAETYIISPMNAIAEVAHRFSYDTPQAREESVRMIEELDIRTGDEIENLYNAYKNTTEDMLRYIDEAEHKNERIENLQNGLILVLADIVESRDKCTGDHVRKTAAYAAIILDQMKKDGIYADQLSDEFVYDVVNSAPLHDIGKIRISDAILNKPGRLTDEEFAVMRSHTTAGMEILDKAIDTVAEESDFLNEARNLAAYHHEKWDGSGYPTGIAGEEIPLSARVMAVADVFDALVSRRSYKEPFSVEKAFDIIREGAGSHFDPNVVTAFLHAEDAIRRTAQMHLDS